jgi:hypothetical protein
MLAAGAGGYLAFDQVREAPSHCKPSIALDTSFTLFKLKWA